MTDKEALKLAFKVGMIALISITLIAVFLSIFNYFFGIVVATFLMIVLEAFCIPFILAKYS